MGSVFGVTIPGGEDRYARQAAGAAFTVLDAVETELSPRIPESDVSRINALPPGRWTRIGLETTRCLVAARAACRKTRGAFDVTLGRPRDLVLDAAKHRVRLRRAGIAVDPGGIGKGYALDRMALVLREWGIHSALVHGGGSTALVVATKARVPADVETRGVQVESGWRIATAAGTVVLRAGAFSGSGTAEQGGHVVDPVTGRPAPRRAAWAWAPTAALADALSTAFMVMPVGAIRRLCGLGGAVGIIASTGRRASGYARFGTAAGISFGPVKKGRGA